MSPVRPPKGASGKPSGEWEEQGGKGGARVPLFLGREMYRRRRLMDAARLLPAFGTALLLLPMLWAAHHGTAVAAVYVFAVWIVLILAAGALAHRLAGPLRRGERRGPAGEAGGDGDGGEG
ncbi:MAG: hypothetical protein ACK5JR_17635 [Tropicimonas sp.]|uniref:hypothetical protein n=1 Tax=Tropicimonas sp. TaxID=2067044 RepID=UPI003A841CE8